MFNYERDRAMHGNIRFSQLAYDFEARDFEVSKDTKEWEYVERLLPPRIIPDIPHLKEFHSGFQPPKIIPGETFSILGTH